MPEHYAIEANVYRGSVTFDTSKIAYVYFQNAEGQQVSFTKRPFVSLTICDQTSSPVIKQTWLRSGNMFIGLKVRFASNYTGDVEWEVKK